MQEYLMILRDIFGGMFKPKKYFQSIYDRDLDMKPLLLIVLLMGILSLISMFKIQNAAFAMANSELPQYVVDNYKNFELILSSTSSSMVIQIIYSLLMTILLSAGLLKLLVWVTKAGIDFKKCLILICYSWGPNILASLLLTISVLVFPIERTMFAQGLFEVIFGSTSQVYKIFTIVDPFYVWSIVILVCYLSYLPSTTKNKKWYFWAYVVYLIPIVMNLMFLIQ